MQIPWLPVSPSGRRHDREEKCASFRFNEIPVNRCQGRSDVSRPLGGNLSR